MIFDKISTCGSGEKLRKYGKTDKQTNGLTEKVKRTEDISQDLSLRGSNKKSNDQRIILVKQGQEQVHSSGKIMVSC